MTADDRERVDGDTAPTSGDTAAPSDEVSEDVAPKSGAAVVLRDDLLPARKPVFRLNEKKKPPHIAAVRANLAGWLLAINGVLYGALVAAVIFGALTADDAQKLAVVLGGPQALAAAAIGFYYAGRDEKK